MHSPLKDDFQQLKRLLWYLKGTSTHGILILLVPLILHAYDNVDWVGDPFDCKSTTSYCAYFGPNLISWIVKNKTDAIHFLPKLNIELPVY